MVTFDPDAVAQLLALAAQGGGWVTFGVTAALITEDNHDDFNLYSSRLVIQYDNNNGPVVPEPGTLALASGGLMLLLAVGRRMRR